MPTPAEAGRLLVEPSTYADERLLYEACAVLREQDPVHLLEHPDFLPVRLLTRHEDVTAVGKDGATWKQGFPLLNLIPLSELAQIASGDGFEPVRFLNNMDGAEHRAYRAVTAQWFQPRTLKHLQERLDVLARESVDRMAAAGGRCDAAEAVAVPYPMQVILALLGLPEGDWPLMLRLTQQLLAPADPDFEHPAGSGAAGTLADALAEFHRYFRAVRDDRRANPTDDLSSVIANAEVPVPQGFPEIVGYYVVFAVAGHDTAASSIAAAIRAFAEHPDQLQRLHDDPSLLPSAVDEVIRWASPARHFLRTATQDTSIRGVEIAKDESVFLSYPAANRDPAAFAAPEVFDIGRTPNPHVAFGSGAHFCLGAHLARMEVGAVLREIAERVESIEVVGEPELARSIIAGGLKHLPIAYAMR